MSSEKLNHLVDEFIVKIAEMQMTDLRATDLHWLEPKDQKELSDWGHDYPAVGNPSAWIADEDIWNKAKKAVRKSWKKYKEPYAVIADVYKKMGGKVKKKKKK
jgi:hypothetical protein